jgi:hypothetical protein
MEQPSQEVIDEIGELVGNALGANGLSRHFHIYRAVDPRYLMLRYIYRHAGQSLNIDCKFPSHTGHDLTKAIDELIAVIKLLSRRRTS